MIDRAFTEYWAQHAQDSSNFQDCFRAAWQQAMEVAAEIVENADTPDYGSWTIAGIAERIRTAGDSR